MRAGAAPQVLCLGEALVDRLGPLGGDPATAAPGDCDDRLGGAPANVACALARLGTPVAFIGRLGQDSIGDSFRELLADRGVDLQGLQLDRRDEVGWCWCVVMPLVSGCFRGLPAMGEGLC